MDVIKSVSMDKLKDSKNDLRALVLDKEDLLDISRIGDTKMAQMIRVLIESINFAILAKRLAESDEKQKSEVYKPERKKLEIKESMDKREFSYSYSLSVSRTHGAEELDPKR